MVTARAPAGTLGHIGLQVRDFLNDSSFKSFKIAQSNDSVEQKEVVGAVRRTLPTLSPATRRMLEAVRLALTVQADPARGFEFKGYVNRGDIARAMSKARLVPYDVEKLNKLLKVHLLSEDYHALPTMTVNGLDGQALQYGAGGEFIYHIPPKIMYALILIENPGAFSILKLRGEAKAKALLSGANQVSFNTADVNAYTLRHSHLDMRLGTSQQTKSQRWQGGMSTRQVVILVLLALVLLTVFVSIVSSFVLM